MLELRGLLRELQRGALLFARVRQLHDDVGAPARQDQLFLGLLELIVGSRQLVARDEAFVEQRLQVFVLLPQPLGLLLRALQRRLRLFDGQRAFAFGHRLDLGAGLLALALGDLQIHLRLAKFLPHALELEFEIGGVEPDQQVTRVDPRCLRARDRESRLRGRRSASDR